MKKKETELTIIILSYNVKNLLINCLESIYKTKTPEDHWQIIVVDNHSSDNTIPSIKLKFSKVKTISSKVNLGFSAGNNLAIPFIKGKYVLFLNPDTIVGKNTIQKSLLYIQEHGNVGALTCKVELPNAKLDYSCHRGFPSPWNTFCYFSGLSKIFPKSLFFSGYSATYLDMRETHEMDCGSGTFLLTRYNAAKEIGWWDEDYFWNGDDIEFFFRLRENGWRVVYYPEVKIIHYKGSSSGLWSTAKIKVNIETKLKSAKYATTAMRIFYKKHYYFKYPILIRDIFLLGIYLLEQYRLLKIKTGIKYK